MSRQHRSPVAAPAPALRRPPAKAASPASRVEADHDAGEAPRPLRHYLGDIRVHDARVLDAPVHFPSRVAMPGPGRAVTRGGAIYVSGDAARLPVPRFGRLLAHEAVHVAQQLDGGGTAPPAEAEVEAQRLEAGALAGVVPEPRLRTDPDALLRDTPHEQAVVERARRRKALLERYLAEWGVRNVRRLRTERERTALVGERERLDSQMAVLSPPGTYEAIERGHLAALNRRPLRVEVTADTVRFHVKLQVRFEGRLSDREASGQFAILRNSLTAGIRTVWNQRLSGEAFGGRTFELIPTIELVPARAVRNRDYWLVTVRPTDTGPIEYEGTSLGEAISGLPTSATDPTVDGGVMSIPPRHVNQPDTLGHETLHLFGLVDRYRSVTHVPPGGQPVNRTDPLRPTGGRPDPLATEHGPILREDMAYLFERLGVYEMEQTRGLDTLRQLEAQGMDQAMVTVELHRQEEIIRLGYDPRSMIPERRSFMKELIESVDQL